MKQEPHHRLKQAREKAGFTQAKDAAERYGWAPSTYTAHENGQNSLRAKVAQRYAEAFDRPHFRVTAAWLLFGVDDSETSGLGIESKLLGMPKPTRQKALDAIDLVIRGLEKGDKPD